MNNDNDKEVKKDGVQSDPFTFIERDSNPNRQAEITQFSTWYSRIFLNEPRSYQEHPITIAENDNTSTVKYFVVYIKPKQDYIDFIEGVQEYVCFWIKNFFILKESFEDLEKYIKSLFSSIIAEKSIYPLLKGDLKDIQPFRQAKLRKEQIDTKEKKRFIFHYIAHQTENTPLDGIEFLNWNCFPLKDLLEISGESSLFIFDRDKAGSLYPIFSEYAQSRNLESHLISFFACGENELLPRSSDYPIDLFTSCLNSPARIALVWHSRQYFCFQSGSLQPLPLMFVEEMETFDGTNTNSISSQNEKERIKAILDDLTSSLRSTVESIALHSMEPKLFVKFFRSDKVLSKLTVNFIFACRILGIFNIHPMSYPRIPDMSNCSEWHTFALRLDASLFILTHPENDPASSMLSHHHFLSQVLVTFQNKIDINASNLNDNSNLNGNFDVPFELSFLKSIIKDKVLCEKGLKTLAKYLDSSPRSIMSALYYPLPKTLFKLLIKNGFKMPSKYLIFCLVKILAFHPTARSLLLKMKSSYQSSIKKVLIDAFRCCLVGNPNLPVQSFSSFSSFSSIESLPKSISLSISKHNQPSFLQGGQISSQSQEQNENIQIASSISLNFSSKKITSSNEATNMTSDNNNNNLNSDAVDESDDNSASDCPIISHLLMILFALLMKDSFKLFKEIIIQQDYFPQSAVDQDIFSQSTIDQLDVDSKIWLLLIITKAAEATKDYQIIKKILALIQKVYNSKPPNTPQSQLIQTAQPPPEIHAAIVCSLASLIKGERSIVRTTLNVVEMRETIEHNAAKYAFNFLDSSLANVRAELFVMAQKFIEANPVIFAPNKNEQGDIRSSKIINSSDDSMDVSMNDDDSDSELLYTKVQLCVEHSQKDPIEKVICAKESSLFESFVSALLKPIRKMLFGPFSLDEISKDPFQFDALFTLSSPPSDQLLVKLNRDKASETNEASTAPTAPPQSNKHPPGSRVVRPQRRQANNASNIFKELLANSSYHHTSPITTKLTFIGDQKFSFGDATGALCIKDWDSGPRYQILPQKGKEPKVELKGKAKISPNPLCCIEFVENGNAGALFFSVDSNPRTSHHNCYVSSLVLPEYSLSTTAAFPLFERDSIYIDKKKGQLFSFQMSNNADDKRSFFVRDLKTDQELPPIVPKYGLTKDIVAVNAFNNVVATCGRGFELFDLRKSSTEPVIDVWGDFLYEPKSLRIIDDSVPSFAVALECHVAVNLDARHPEWMVTTPIECQCQDDKRVTYGFDFFKKLMVSAISTEHGISCVHMRPQSHYQNEILNKKNGMKLANSTSLLFHPEKYELAFVCNQDYIITAV